MIGRPLENLKETMKKKGIKEVKIDLYGEGLEDEQLLIENKDYEGQDE